MLTHVSYWKDGHWQRITAAEAFKQFNRSVSSNEEIFRCDICGNAVSLAHGLVRDAFFKHSRGDEDKSCEERSQYYSETLDYKSFSLPIKIVRNSDLTWRFEIGIPPISDDIYRRYIDKHIVIYKNDRKQVSWLVERIQSSGYTFLYFDNTLSETYRLSVSDPDLRKILNWPETIVGYSGSGRLFDFDSGRMLAIDSDVYVDKSYYYITQTNLYRAKDVLVKRIGYLNGGLLLYEIKAETATPTSAFFFRRLGARLSTHPLDVITLWPPNYGADDFIYCDSDYVYSLITGDGVCDINVLIDGCHMTPSAKISDTASLYEVALKKGSSNMLVGRNSTLRNNKYFTSKTIIRTNKPTVCISDMRHEKWDNNIYKVPPYKQRLFINSQFDADVYVETVGEVTQKYTINAAQTEEIRPVKRGSTVSVYLGNTLVRRIAITSLNQIQLDNNSNDKLYCSLLSSKGEFVPFDHSKLSAIAQKVQDYRIKKWIKAVSRKGIIRDDAYNLLRQFCQTVKGRKA